MQEDLSYTRPCFYCGTHVDPQAQATYRRIVGWERKAAGINRRGGSDIVLRDHRDEYACHPCIERLRAGFDVNQQGLFA